MITFFSHKKAQDRSASDAREARDVSVPAAGDRHAASGAGDSGAPIPGGAQTGAVASASAGSPAAAEETVPAFTLPKNAQIPYEILGHIPEDSASHYKIVPVGLRDGVLEVGMVNPDDLEAIDALNFISRKESLPYKIYRISEPDFQKILTMYRSLGGEVSQALTELESELTAEEQNIQAAIDEQERTGTSYIREDAPVIKIVATILRYAVDGRASDVHIEPTEKKVKVRFRVDGILHTSLMLPRKTHRAIVARIKVLSSMRLDERRKPQDGRFSATIGGRKIDFRVSTFPTYYGEKIVMRILDREHGFVPMEELGLSAHNLQLMRQAIQKPHGLILISGPTGSGKSTTLYSILAELDRETKNILSLEDPIEYHIEGVNQSQVRPEIGYTFANGLRTTLRQDPDIIMVGEIRDGETARLAVQAALTGHLVLSTIHTNSAIGVVPRLVDMGVDPYLIAPTLILSVAQRLVRRLCPNAGVPVPVTDSMRLMLEKEFADLPPQHRPMLPEHVFEAQPTPECPTGMRGRLAVFEMLPASKDFEKAILADPSEDNIWKIARAQGMLTMKEDAMIKAFAGLIPYSEVEKLGGQLLAETVPIDVDQARQT